MGAEFAEKPTGRLPSFLVLAWLPGSVVVCATAAISTNPGVKDILLCQRFRRLIAFSRSFRSTTRMIVTVFSSIR